MKLAGHRNHGKPCLAKHLELAGPAGGSLERLLLGFRASDRSFRVFFKACSGYLRKLGLSVSRSFVPRLRSRPKPEKQLSLQLAGKHLEDVSPAILRSTHFAPLCYRSTEHQQLPALNLDHEYASTTNKYARTRPMTLRPPDLK